MARNAMLSYNKGLKETSRQLRQNMTEAERLFWSRVRGKQLSGAQVYRQKIIGNFIVDFYCPQARLVVEIDGGLHYEGRGVESDAIRDDYLRPQGLKVLRFSNQDVLENTAGVVDTHGQARGTLPFGLLEVVYGQIPRNPPLPKGD